MMFCRTSATALLKFLVDSQDWAASIIESDCAVLILGQQQRSTESLMGYLCVAYGVRGCEEWNPHSL